MRICIPTLDNKGAMSQISDHFGSAPCFTIYDCDSKNYEIQANATHDHVHGRCRPMDHLHDKQVDCVLCRGLGRRALEKLRSSGIKVFRTDHSTVRDAIENLSTTASEQIDPADACQDHSCH